MKKRVLITGANGFIGRHISKAAPEDAIVVSLGRSANNDICCDLRIEEPILGDSTFDTIIHCAGTTDAAEAAQLNFEGTRHLCEALEKSGNLPKNFVFLSSCSVYGLSKAHLADETIPLNPTSPYGESKADAERFLTEWSNAHGVSLSILRPASVIGTGMTGKMMELAVRIANGSYIHMPGLNPQRSFVHVEDLAEIVWAIAGIPGCYNVTDGTPHSLHDIAEGMAHRIHDKRILSMPRKLVKILSFLGHHTPLFRKEIKMLENDLTFSSARLEALLPDRTPIDVVERLNERQ